MGNRLLSTHRMRNLLISALFAGVLLLSACSSVQSDLVIPDDGPGYVCSPADANGDLLVGVDYFRNDGSSMAEINQISVVDGTNIGVMSFGVLINDEEGFRGALPPSEASLSPNRVLSVGEEAVVQVQLALGNESEPGRAKALQVEYGDPGAKGSKSISTVMAIEVVPSGQVCG